MDWGTGNGYGVLWRKLLGNVLDGKLMYLKMVKGEDDSVYLRLKMQFDELCNSLHDNTRTTQHGITYVETLPVLEFERKNNTAITIVTTKPKEFYTVHTPRLRQQQLYGS